jgi:hypothetical protein
MTLLLPHAYTGEGAVSADGDGGSEALLLGHSVCTFLEYQSIPACRFKSVVEIRRA